MAKRPGPIAEQNPFLTGTDLAPVTSLSEKLGLSSGVRYEEQHNTDGEELLEESQRSVDESDEDEIEVDKSVQEEMAKLEDTFHERGLKYRMIDRIGEGDARRANCIHLASQLTNQCLQGLSPPSIKPKTFITNTTRMSGT